MILAFVITRFCACDLCIVPKIDKTPAANRDVILASFRAPWVLLGRAFDEEDRIIVSRFYTHWRRFGSCNVAIFELDPESQAEALNVI